VPTAIPDDLDADLPPLEDVLCPLDHDPDPGVACRLVTRFRCGACPADWLIWHDDQAGQYCYQHRAPDRPRPDRRRHIDDWQLARDFAADIYGPIRRHYGPRVHPPVAGGLPWRR